MTLVPRSIALRFLLTLLPAIALLLLGFGWWVLEGLKGRVKHQVEQVLMPQQAAALAKAIRELLKNLQESSSLIARAAPEAISKSNPGDRREQFKLDLQKEPRLAEDLSLAVLADPRGKVLAYATLGEAADLASRYPLPIDEVEDVGAEPWFVAITGGKGSLWGDKERSRYLNREPNAPSPSPSDYSLPLAMRVDDARGVLIGVIYCLAPWTRVQQVLDAARDRLKHDAKYQNASVGLCDAAGTYLANSDRTRYGQRSEPEAFRTALAATARGVSDDGTVVSAWEVADVPQQWRPVVQIEHDDLYEAVGVLRSQLWLAIAAIVVVSAAWALRASRQVLVPVQRLAQAAIAIAKGDYSVRVRERGRDELDDLARAFNRMARDVEQGRSKLAKAEREAAWAEMARQVAHEIKNPLTPMRMSAQMLIRARREGDPRQDELVERLARTVLEQTDALSRIASDFRQFAGRSERQRVPVPIDDVLTAAGTLFLAAAEERQVALAVGPGAAGVHVLGDAQDLQRVLHNLLLNAFEASPRGGRVELASHAGSGRVVVTVADGGAGVPVEARSRLFEPNFTTKSSGTGLGLAICRKIVEEHNGTIVLEHSEPGRTVFRVELPVAVAGTG